MIPPAPPRPASLPPRTLALLAACAALACATRTPIAPPPPAPDSKADRDLQARNEAADAGPQPTLAEIRKSDPLVAPPGERERKARALVAEVAKQRGLAETRPLDISFEDPTTFRASLDRVAAEDKADPEVERAKWTAFGFAGPEVQPKAIGQKILEEQVAAFYDVKEKRLHVPIEPPPSSVPGADAKSQQEAEIVLAHEIEHGLQDQHFPIPDLDSEPNDDLALAIKAIYEGDATFVMLAVPIARHQPLDGGQLLLAARALRAMPMGTLEQLSGKQSPELEKAPKLARAELLLPYLGGLALVAELYNAGGYPLVDQLFRHPPQSTEQVLHPEKYVAGEQPVQVLPPPLPAGTRELARGTLGELGVRTLLSGCLSDADSANGAKGWGGDSYLVAVRPHGELVLEWSTSWDSPEDAARFDAAISHAKLASCFPAVKKVAGSDWTLEEGVRDEVLGNSVSIERGLPRAEAAAVLKKLLKLPRVPEKNAPPVGDVRLAP